MTSSTPSAATPEPPDDEAEHGLADLLEACLRAERARPGSAASLIQRAPEPLRPELEHLLALGRALRRTPSAAARSDLSAVRAWLMARTEPTDPE
jgi:hypothetical protein